MTIDRELQKEQKAFFDVVAEALRKEGFEVRDHQGWPLASTPATFELKKKLLDLKLHVYAEMTIYKEGVLFLPGIPNA